MIHYHGTPSSGARADAVRFVRNRHVLVSYAYQEDMGLAGAAAASFILDNGAFTAWKQGAALDVPGFIRWVEVWFRHPCFDGAVIPDVIDGNAADNDALLREWPAHLRGKGVPVWHMHEDLSRLERLVCCYPVVALGSSGEWPTPGTPSWWTRMAEAMTVACDSDGYPLTHLHGLRMLSTKIFPRLPLRSADSANAAINSGSVKRFGMYTPPTAGQRAEVIASRIEAHGAAAFWNPKNITEVEYADDAQDDVL